MRASLSRCVIARGPEKRDQSRSLRGPRRLRPATSRSYAFWLYPMYSFEPRPRIRECLTLRVYVERRYLARCVAVRDLGLLPCSYNFLTQGKIACENILRARICTAVRIGAKWGTHFVSTLWIVFSPYVRKLVGGGVIHMQFVSNK